MDATETIQARSELRDRLSQELDTTVEPERKGALSIAIRCLISAIDIQETLIAFEQGKPQKITGRDMDTYDPLALYLKSVMSPIEPTSRFRPCHANFCFPRFPHQPDLATKCVTLVLAVILTEHVSARLGRYGF